MVKPLDGVRVVEISQVYSLPFAGLMLAELGADVIKVENPTSPEVMRRGGWIRNGIPAAFLNLNRGKRFVGIDAATDDGRRVLAELVASADVLIDNLRPGKMEKLGLGWDDVRARHPQLISASVTGFGDDGPMAHLPCYDFVVQAMVGMVEFQKDPSTGAIDLVRHFVVDKTVAHLIVEGVLASLLLRAKTGRGERVSVNMLDAGAHFLWPDGMIPQTFIDDVTFNIRDGAAMRVYPTTDGAVVMMPPLHGWAELCAATNQLHLADDERLADRRQMIYNIDLMMDLVGEGLAVMSTNDVLASCAEFDIATARVDSRDDLLDNPQAMWNGTIGEHDIADVGRARLPRPPWRFDESDVSTATRIGLLGCDTEAVLRELGYDDGRLAALLASGAVVFAA
jgi:crotonobetainyl-CoA:carnitine CoA-transferase CaiB-like acyl-CoA transferase